MKYTQKVLLETSYSCFSKRFPWENTTSQNTASLLFVVKTWQQTSKISLRTKAPSEIGVARTQKGCSCWKSSPHWGGFVLHCAKNPRVMGLIPPQGIHLRVGFHDPCGSLATQSMLWFCDSILRSTNKGRWASIIVTGDQANAVNWAVRAPPLLHMNSFTEFIYMSSKWVQALSKPWKHLHVSVWIQVPYPVSAITPPFLQSSQHRSGKIFRARCYLSRILL